MRIKIFNYSTIIFVAITICLFISFCIATIILSLELSSLKSQFDRTGLVNLLEYFSPALNIGAFFTGSLAILLTILRMRQTAENNQLNNFFKHREEFYKEFMVNKLFVELSEITDRDIDSALRNLYNIFYYSSPNNFYPRINLNARKIIKKFIDLVIKSNLNKSDFDITTVQKDELIKISDNNYPDLKNLVTSMNAKIVPQMKSYSKEMGEDIKNQISSFVYINEIYWSLIFYKYILLFDGEAFNDANEFHSNFIDLKIKCYYDEAKLNVKENKV